MTDHENKMMRLVHRLWVRWYIESDRTPVLLQKYHDMFRIPLYINDAPMDEIKQPKNLFGWFLNKFEDVDDYRSLITMKNIINSTIITNEEKESYLELHNMTDEVTTAENSPFK